MQLSEEELREDIEVLNVVNFGGGSYVLYAEILEEEGEIEVDPEPYSDNFDRPARLLPVEGKALVALNAAMYAADKSDRIAALKVRMRDERATTIIWSYAVMKSVGVALTFTPATSEP